MGSYNTKLYDAYGKTPKKAIASLDAKLYFKYGGRVHHNISTGEYSVSVNNGQRRFVHVEGTPGIGYRAYINA
jgi:hypothetical protein